MIVPAVCLLVGLWATPQSEQRQGVTVLLDRALEEKLAAVHGFLDQGQEGPAVALLQEILEANPAALVGSGEDRDLLRGAALVAEELLGTLGPDARQQRDEMVARAAEVALANALQPPDGRALQELAVRYAGTAIGRRAALAREELARDRGLGNIDSRQDAALELPAVEDLNDPRLPLVESRGLRPLWRFDFSLMLDSRGHRLTIQDGIGYLSNGVEVVALRLGDGSVMWRFEGPPGWSELRRDEVRELFEGADEDMLTAPVVSDGVVLAVLQEAYGVGRKDEFERRRGWNDIAVRRQLPARRLYAFDANTGEMLWRTEPPWLAQREAEPRGLLAAPPAAAAGRVFVPVYDAVGTIDLSMQALDLYTGQPLWRTFLVSGQQETNLFGNILSEMASQPPLAAAGRVHFSTNLGTVVCLEADSGRAIWSRRYERSPVRTYQNGRPSQREETFANGPLVYDGEHLICAPVDSEWSFALRAADGSLVTSWPYRDPRFGELRHLIGASREGAWFNGTHLAMLPFPGTGARLRVSDPLYTRLGHEFSRHPAALARGEVLTPAVGGVEILDAGNLRARDRLEDLGQSRSELGPVQVAPGLAFVLRPDGVTAFSSPEAILLSLARSGWDDDTVERLLPFLEGVDLSGPGVARKVAERSEQLAADAPTRELRERLTMVAARGRFAAHEGPAALSLLEPILTEQAGPRRVRAAELALDVLERGDPSHRLMDPVLEILANDPARRVLRFDGRTERKDLALARARVRQTGKQAFGGEAHLDALLRLLRLDGLHTERQGTLTLEEWARSQLLLALEDPRIAARVEARARTAFELEPPSDSLMRRFAGTDTAWAWLGDRARVVGNDRKAALELAGWLRGYAWPQADASTGSLVAPELLVGGTQPRRLPGGLHPLAALELGAGQLLDFGVFADRLAALVRVDHHAFLIEVDASGASRRGEAFPLAASRSLLPNEVRDHCFVHEEGASVIIRDRWMKIPRDGSAIETVTLPGSVSEMMRFGELLALLCAREDGAMLLEVRDLASATRLLRVPLPLRADRFHAMAWTGRDLLVLQDRTLQAHRVPLFDREPPSRTGLIRPPTTYELDRMIPLANGLVLPVSSSGQKLLWMLQGEQEEALAQRPHHDLRTFRTPTGFGWLQAPMSIDSREEQGPVLYWQGAQETRGRDFGFGSGEVRFPQLESFSRVREDFPTDRLLTAHPNDRGEVQLRAWRLPRAGDPVASWSLDLDEVPYNRLVGRLPVPAAADSGWLIPLKLLNTGSASPRLVLLLVGNDGVLRDRMELEAPGNSSLNIEAIYGDGYAGLRHEDSLYLLGSAR